MYYFEKDYIMRLIHGIARTLARLLFGEELGHGELVSAMEISCRENNDYLRQMVDNGQINTAEEKLFVAWDNRQKAALVIAFYDHVNSKDDDFLKATDFSRDEIISGLEDAMKAIDLEIPEYLRIG